jgi:Inner membrane protein YgaP-like, transmembrane domain
MTVEGGLRLMAGAFILISLGLGYWISPYWYLFTAFVGLNLLQSGVTNWCPAMFLLRKLGLRESLPLVSKG